MTRLNQPNYRRSLCFFGNSFLWAVLLVIGSGLNACGSGGSSTSSPIVKPQGCNNCGKTIVSLTDAAGDFVSYIVKVTSLKLNRADGTFVETVSVPTQVDFAQLTHLAEIVSALNITAGNYTSASITLDYSGATIIVSNGATGVSIAPSQIINGATSLPLAAPNTTLITLTLALPAIGPLTVVVDTDAHLALDFNLAASNTVTPSTTNPTTVTVNPVLTASLSPDANREEHIRGTLVKTNTSLNSYLVNVSPFNDSVATIGQLTVNTTATTAFVINGTSYTGAAGLAQLATLVAGTVTAAFGGVNATTFSFTATRVVAGTSAVGTGVAGSTMGNDGLEGIIVARTGNTLTLANDHVTHSDHEGLSYISQVTVTVGSATTVTEEGQVGTFTTANISVGQNAFFTGKLAISGSGNATLDATAGAARMELTRLQGVVISVNTNSVTVNLTNLGDIPAASFAFAGTGTSSVMDAVPTAYSVSLPATLSTAGLSVGSAVQYSGFVAPFGLAPPDFMAIELTATHYSDPSALAELEIRWPVGVTAPFSNATSATLTLSQATLVGSTEHEVHLEHQPETDLTTLAGPVQLVPDSLVNTGKFAISHRISDTVDNFSTFAAFETALVAALNGTVGLMQVEAQGSYNATSGVMSVGKMVAALNN